MSTYSPSLRIELINTGDQAGTWGNTTNSNLGTLIESAIAGYTSVSITSANQALTALNGTADQSRNMTIALTTTTTANFNVYAPPAEKTYVIRNASSYTATIYNSTVIGNTTAAGTGVAIPAGKTMTVWSDGTNFSSQVDYLPTLTLGSASALAAQIGSLLYPVGAIYTNATNSANPSTYLGFGTWAAFGAGRVPVGFDAGNSLFNAAEKTGGSYDATLVSHTHSWSGSSSGSVGNTDLSHTHTYSSSFSGTTSEKTYIHQHSYSGSVNSDGSHTHTLNVNSVFRASDCCSYLFPQPNGAANSTQIFALSTAGLHSHGYSGVTSSEIYQHDHSVSGTVSGTTSGASTAMSHNHPVSISTTGSNSTVGSSATNANVQPYITVYMWKRTA